MVRTGRLTIALAGATALVTVATSAQQAPPSPEQKPAQQTQTPQNKDAPKSYLPDLGDFMAGIQRNHEKLWFAGQARNWPLADYHVAELKEILSDVEDYVPRYKSVPIDEMIDAVITGQIADLERAVAAKDFSKFSASFDAVTQACNSCHQAVGRGFIVIKRPTLSTYTNQDFTPKSK
jgi:hypothetical protein